MDREAPMSDWLWHLLHDPVNENPWAMLALIVVLVGPMLAYCGPSWWRTYRRPRGDRDA
jgi:hypothetical protein